jgi:protein involved in polysaccharide export with SLBB domain
MPTTETSVLKLLGRSLAVAALAWSLSAGLHAQISTLPQGMSGLGVTAPDANAVPVSPANALQLSNTLNAAKPATDQLAPELAPARLPLKPPAPNQFQRFVQESTGRLLPVFGRDLFDAPQNYSANTAVPAPDNYVLGPGDQVQLQVSGPQDFSTNLVLDRNGQVNLPKVGPVTLAGVAVRDLEQTLSSHLGKVFTNFKASATLGRLRGIQVYVVGQAQQPGTFQLSSLSTLVNALFASGGPSANGSMRAIQLKRGGKTITTLDLYDFIAKGDKSQDLPLLAGDVIVIPPVGPRVAITGAFDQAAIYELKPGSSSVGDILNLGGGVPALAKSKKAVLERINPNTSPARSVQEIALNTQGLQSKLQDGDVLVLLDISPAFANAVTLQGVVADPVRSSWFDGMKVLDLIPDREALITPDYYKRKNVLVQTGSSNIDAAETSKEAGKQVDTRIRSMVDQINWEYAVIERLDRNKLSTQLIPFNLGKAVLQKDPAHNLALLPGDVVTILSQTDLRLPQERQSRLVRLEGEVAAPGVYQAMAGETLPQLIKRIGGLTPEAYVFGTELSRESVKTRQQQNLDTLIRRLEAQSQSQQGSLVANRNNSGAADQTAAILQLQQAQLKSQIERLKSFKSNGRMSLELDPRNPSLAALPDLPLEDGDRIMVPSTPGFVAAFGSVNNENMFIYRNGKTVGDVIKSAGLTEDAEPSQAFVLRADGSIIARNDRSGWFGSNFESVAMMPGDTLVVPAQMDRESRYNAIIRGFKDWTQILANLGLGVAALNSL